MAERPDGYPRFEPVPEPEWEPDIRRITLVLDVDMSVVAMPADTWVLYRLDMLARSLHELGVMANPVRIEVDGCPRQI